MSINEKIAELLKNHTVDEINSIVNNKDAEWNKTKTITLKGHTGAVMSVCFSPDGQRLASGSWDTTVKVWDAATGQELITIKHDYYIYSIAISPDGKTVVSGDGGGNIKITKLP